MDDKIAQLILDELFSSLETLETQTAAILQFLKDKGASDEQLAPYLEQAGKAASIKRRAARVRIDYLISGIANPPQKAVEQDAAKGEKKSPEPSTEKPKEKVQEREQGKEGENQSGDRRKKTEGKAESEIEGKTEEDSEGEKRAEERAAAGASNDEDEKEKRTAPASDKEKTNKPAQPDATDRKMDEKAKNDKNEMVGEIVSQQVETNIRLGGIYLTRRFPHLCSAYVPVKGPSDTKYLSDYLRAADNLESVDNCSTNSRTRPWIWSRTRR
jgi:hypothetical protein